MSKRRYSDADKATALAALDANDGNVKGTARQLGIPHKTLDEWAKGRVVDAVADIRTEKRADIADRLETLIHQIIDVMPDKMGEAALKDLGVTMGIAVDKRQVLSGKPTSIDKVITENPRDEVDAALDEIASASELEPV